MIKSVLIFNNLGKARLLRFYDHYTETQQQEILNSVYSVISKRSDSVCQFVEGISIPHFDDKTKLIYRHYATLYFVFVVDEQESELGILDLVHVFVESLDKYFGDVCEVHLIFNSEKVHLILDEIVMGGMVVETNLKAILTAIKDTTDSKFKRRALEKLI
eukprot:TRINITY_DN774251_c0_g1_i1.p1 TRINITY_DN774251_c0_g1~~TRINITY_DN774251_c0_g1_i1.p1  ORF type:complete len:175 (-),score=24.35 TRINITY_DN774251_c0_g1_i1:336-815(-)